MTTTESAKIITREFLPECYVSNIKPMGNGLINDTFLVETDGNDSNNYVLQRINNDVFKDVDLLQHNIEVVTNHIRKKLLPYYENDIDQHVLRFIAAKDGKTYKKDSIGNYWRMSVLIKDSYTLQTVNEATSMSAGLAFGQFESLLIDLKEPLGETIPRFHDMELRAEQLQEAIENNYAGRLHLVKEELKTINSMTSSMCKAEQMHRDGLLKKRICHCDTKVNNMLVDKDGQVLCVIDLDTVMPSFVFSDYGDFLRTAANSTTEDDSDLEKISFREDIFEQFTIGYLRSTANFLSETERANLPFAVSLFPFMQSVRFLTDYLNGDTYYKTKYPEHNLVRARNQLALFKTILDKMPYIERFIKDC